MLGKQHRRLQCGAFMSARELLKQMLLARHHRSKKPNASF